MKKFAGKLIRILNIIAAIALLLSYSAPLVNPSVFVLPAFFGLAYPYMLMLNLLFLLYWIIRFKKEFLISLVVILLGWNHLQNLLPLNLNNPGRTGGDQKFSLMTYNVRSFNLYNWTKKENSREEIFNLVLAEDPAILCFQEFYTSDKPGKGEEDISRQLNKYPHRFIYYYLQNRVQGGFGLATYSKFPVIRTSRIPFEQTLNQAVYTDLLVNSDTIRVFNIHLQSIKFAERNYDFLDSLTLKYNNKQLEEMLKLSGQIGFAFKRRSEQAKIIQRYIASSPYPVIVCGDFNDTPVSFAYRVIKKGLRDAFRTAGRGFGNTYAGELPSFRIDYILYSDYFKASNFKRIKSNHSDHFPIVSGFHVREDP